MEQCFLLRPVLRGGREFGWSYMTRRCLLSSMKSVTASHLVCDVTRDGGGTFISCVIWVCHHTWFCHWPVEIKALRGWSMAQWCQCIHKAPGRVPSTTETNIKPKSNYRIELGSWPYPSKLWLADSAFPAAWPVWLKLRIAGAQESSFLPQLVHPSSREDFKYN